MKYSGVTCILVPQENQMDEHYVFIYDGLPNELLTFGGRLIRSRDTDRDKTKGFIDCLINLGII